MLFYIYIYIHINFVFSSFPAVPGRSVSCSWSDSDSVFWRGAPWSQQCQRQTDHRAGKTCKSTQKWRIASEVLSQLYKDATSCLPSQWQICMLNCQHLLDAVNMRRSQPYCNSSNLEMSDSLVPDQMARIYQDLCSYSGHQRPACYRDNMPITVWTLGSGSSQTDHIRETVTVSFDG